MINDIPAQFKSPSLPTPEAIRQRMKAEGWVLVFDCLERRRYYEIWELRGSPSAEWAELDMATRRKARVKGNLETILKGIAILNGSGDGTP